MNDIPSSSQRRDGVMLAPGCQLGLLIADRRGGELYYRPRCRGVWFDPSRLDKVIARNPPTLALMVRGTARIPAAPASLPGGLKPDRRARPAFAALAAMSEVDEGA
ncbi:MULTISPECIES: zf-TFIIB domain-containing protein [Bacteria]|jgi:hypothetical protein|uniref:Transcription factor zinc-finger domain-containing protein n=2 Tax=Sphingomonadaceae TaxID=41297 RepID=A0A7Y6EIE9_9SPHN|nr:hypothetical protein [Sphingomonas sp. TX0522]NUU48052.1 hypothetical protein [Sphingomonas zeae]PVE52101.1 hypothetical protein DC425_15675 [Sphingomonas sp. TPD3009]GEM71788.1 hypothetical protein SAQ01S_15540 [Sphingomonas aquatilis NBRC 16722]